MKKPDLEGIMSRSAEQGFATLADAQTLYTYIIRLETIIWTIKAAVSDDFNPKSGGLV